MGIFNLMKAFALAALLFTTETYARHHHRQHQGQELVQTQFVDYEQTNNEVESNLSEIKQDFAQTEGMPSGVSAAELNARSQNEAKKLDALQNEIEQVYNFERDVATAKVQDKGYAA